MVRFQKYAVVGPAGRARVHYSLDNRTDGRACVTIYAKDYDRALDRIFADDYQNESDMQTDYFEKGKVVLFPEHPLYVAARSAVEARAIIANAKPEA